MGIREIIFRGKRVDNGEWVEGDLRQFNPYGINYKNGKGKVTWIIFDNGTNGGIECEVIPETVGQYTGLTDKNDKKIFEGDILSEKPPMNETAYIGYVAYDNELAVWRFMIKNDTEFNGVLLGSYSTSYTVISNIHDNPELLEVHNVTENSDSM